VLSLPPAFVLSQDQTLKLERRCLADHYILDGAHQSSQTDAALERSTDFVSFLTAFAIRKDNVAYVSLSSDSHVKQRVTVLPVSTKANALPLRARPGWPMPF
jgi:hypothetical protein